MHSTADLCILRTGVTDLASLQVEITNEVSDNPGSLIPVLSAFEKYGLNLTHMESKLHQYSFGGATFQVDFEGTFEDEATQLCVAELRDMSHVARVQQIPAREVPWFPASLRELDNARKTLDGGTALISEDHPGFSVGPFEPTPDQVFLARMVCIWVHMLLLPLRALRFVYL